MTTALTAGVPTHRLQSSQDAGDIATTQAAADSEQQFVPGVNTPDALLRDETDFICPLCRHAEELDDAVELLLDHLEFFAWMLHELGSGRAITHAVAVEYFGGV